MSGDGFPNAATVLNEAITEKEFMELVVRAAKWLGWMVWHPYDSRRSVPGFPDLLCLRAEKMLAIELKSERGRATAAQDAWLAAFREAGTKAFVFRPSDWDKVLEELR